MRIDHIIIIDLQNQFEVQTLVTKSKDNNVSNDFQSPS